MKRFLVAGNWKMNGTVQSSRNLASEICHKLHQTPEILNTCEFLCCPPSLYLGSVRDVCAGSPVSLGAQDCSAEEQGAHTGDIAADMLADSGAAYVIVGHSERRSDHNETSEMVSSKSKTARDNNLIPIICIGETLDQRQTGKAQSIVREQLESSISKALTAEDFCIAYEPVWAIGSGQAASEDDVKDMHEFIRKVLSEMVDNADTIRILYGGSVKPENASSLASVANVNGFLIGGASLKADSFVGIGKAVAKH